MFQESEKSVDFKNVKLTPDSLALLGQVRSKDETEDD